MSKTLVFTSAVGPKYHSWANRLFRSLRYGKYTGDVIVLSDNGYKPKPAVDVRRVLLQPEIFDKLPSKRKLPPTHRARVSRYYLDKMVDISGYSQVFYLDCDCWVGEQKDFNELIRPGNWFTRRYQKFGTVSGTNDRFAVHAMSDDLVREVAEESTISSGSWLVEAKYYQRMGEEVRKIYRDRCKWHNDQACLNAFVVENRDWMPWKYFPDEEVVIVRASKRTPQDLSEAIVLHSADASMK